MAISTTRKLKEDYLALGIILLGTILRLVIILSGELNLYTDEAQYWDWSRSLDFSYYSKGPLIAYYIWFWTKIFGPTELGVRFGAVFNVFWFQVILYWGLKKICFLKGDKESYLPLWALLIVNSAPLFLVSGILMTTDNLLVLCYLICLLGLYFYFSFEQKKYLLLIGIFFALGILAKYTMLIFGPLSLILVYRQKPYLGKKLFFTLVLSGLVGLLPIFKWNLDHNFVGLKHVLYRGSLAGSKAKEFFRLKNVPEFLGSQVGVLAPWWFVLFFLGSWRLSREKSMKISLGERDFLLIFSLPVFFLFFLLSFHSKVEANWPALSYLTGIVIIAFGVKRLSFRLQISLLVLSGFVFILFHSLPFLKLPDKIDILKRMRGYRDLGEKIVLLKKEHFRAPDKVFLLSDSYGVTAELSFYVPGQKRAYCVNLGRKLNQYDIFGPPLDKIGFDAILVSKERFKKVPVEVLQMFTKVEGPFTVETKNKDKKGLTFSLILGYNYTGYWPKPKDYTF